jgi:hypothetical protein
MSIKNKQTRKRANVKSFLGPRISFSSLDEDEHDEEDMSLSSMEVEVAATATVIAVDGIGERRTTLSPSLSLSSISTEQESSSRLQDPLRQIEEQHELHFELDSDLNDMDNYMLSVYINDESSVYSKGTASTSFSSSSSSSVLSTRSRHRGAYWKRKQKLKEQPTWIESMQDLEFLHGWTPNRGWQITRKQWDNEPDPNVWTDHCRVFDQVPRKRIEI